MRSLLLRLGLLKPSMSYTQLVSELCAREGGSRQVDAAQMREVVSNLKKLIEENEGFKGNRVIDTLRYKNAK